MLEFLSKYASLLFANWQRALLGGVIVSSTVIVLLGVLKKFLINKISNKLVRKVILAFSSVLLVFPLTALYFLGDEINFDHYWLGSGMNAVLTILVYWLYENTALRDLIHKIAYTVGNKFAVAFAKRITDTSANTEKANVAELKEMTNSLKNDVANTLVKNSYITPVLTKSTYHDSDLDDI